MASTRPVTEVLSLDQAVRFQFRRTPARAEASHLTPGSLPHPAKFATGPANPGAARAHTFVTTASFLAALGLESLRDLPDAEALGDAGLKKA